MWTRESFVELFKEIKVKYDVLWSNTRESLSFGNELKGESLVNFMIN
jgi:hypothetical protein